MSSKKLLKNPSETINLLITAVESKLSEYKRKYKGLSWREKILLLVELNKPVIDLGIYSNPETIKVSARERLRLYFLENVGQVIEAKELEIVAGISEYARRIRELRIQDGYKIITGASSSEDFIIKLKPTQYILIDGGPDRKAASRWHIANRIRKEKQGGSKGRILKYLKEFVEEVITSEELWYVANAKEYGRRIRELRTEDGYAIATNFTGRPDLKMGEYVLESLKRVTKPHDRKIPFEIQKEVYQRDKNSCRVCNWNHKKWTKEDPRILELHHVVEHAKGGKNSANNIILICSKCHVKLHSRKLKLPTNILD